MAENSVQEEVLKQLEDYNANKRRIAALRYELEQYCDVTPEEMIESMNFSHGGDGVRSSVGHTSDKTPYIALNYLKQAEDENRRSREEIMAEYLPVVRKVDRLEHYISLLESQEAAVIYLTYRDRLKNMEIGKRIGMSAKSVSKVKRRALAQLCQMFDFTSMVR